jgi:predicted esterase
MRYIIRSKLGATAAALFCSFRPGPASSFSLFAEADKRTIFQSTAVRTTSYTSSSRLPSPSSSLSSTMDDQTTKSSSSSSSSPATTIKKLKILALHGSGGTAKEFPKRLDALNKALMSYSSSSSSNDNKVQLEITTVQGPFDKDDGYSWWTMPDGVRSFNAKEYTGFEESATKVLDVWEKEEFDIVLGHSQGAILIASLIAMKRTPYHPPGGYIMNGCSFPNPYTQQLESLSSRMNTNSVVVADDNNKSNDDDDDSSSSHSNVLFVLGKQDKITPNSSGEKVRDLLKKGGFTVSSCYHDGGHGFPEEDTNDEAMKQIVNWILR